jgi:NADPH-dependent 7-cyano-7-deazaguanine reductase QueF-like protein
MKFRFTSKLIKIIADFQLQYESPYLIEILIIKLYLPSSFLF